MRGPDDRHFVGPAKNCLIKVTQTSITRPPRRCGRLRRQERLDPLAGEFEAAFATACLGSGQASSFSNRRCGPRNFNCAPAVQVCVSAFPLESGLRLSAIGGHVDAVLGLPFGKGLALEHKFFAEVRIKIAE